MSGVCYERLSARENLFLVAESAEAPMHVAAVQIAEARPLEGPTGGFDLARFARGLECALDRIPRYRQRLRFPSLGGRPVWVDDSRFDLAYHVRQVRLPQPGTPQQLKREVSRIAELALDRSRPLWELWVVEGLAAGEQLALVSKIHHCMLDGVAGADLAALLASPDPHAEVGTPERYRRGRGRRRSSCCATSGSAARELPSARRSASRRGAQRRRRATPVGASPRSGSWLPTCCVPCPRRPSTAARAPIATWTG